MAVWLPVSVPGAPAGRWLRGCALLVLTLVVAGCASFEPKPAVEAPYRARAQSQGLGGVTITAAVLSAVESEQEFGLALEEKGIQPVWLRIENRSEHDNLFVPAALDPDYFSPQEVDWAFRSGYSADGERAMEADLGRKSMRLHFPPGVVAEGFVHTTIDEGIKYVSVQMFRIGDQQQFDFVFDVPGFSADYHRVDFSAIVPAGTEQSVTREQLRDLLTVMPCCVLGPDGKTPGDPINIVVIGRGAKGFVPFARRDWGLDRPDQPRHRRAAVFQDAGHPQDRPGCRRGTRLPAAGPVAVREPEGLRLCRRGRASPAG
jgi:hypothetical protein